MNTDQTNKNNAQLVKALQATLVPLEPPAGLLARLQTEMQRLDKPAPRKLQLWLQKPETPYVGIAGLFMVLMTVALGFRTAGAIIGAIALAAEAGKQARSGRKGRFTQAA